MANKTSLYILFFVIIIFSSFQSQARGLYPFKEGHFFGFRSLKDTIIPARYDSVKQFSEGLAAFKSDGNWGFIDTLGTVIVLPQYEQVGSFVDRYAKVEKGGLWGVVDTYGEYVVEPKFDEIGTFDNGKATVVIHGKEGVVNLQGHVLWKPLISNDAVVLAILLIILGLVFYTSSLTGRFWKKFYTIIPSVLLCYFIPALLNTLGVISGESDYSNLYYVSSRFLLPASLVLLTLSIDLKAIIKLGPKALIMFFTGTVGIMLGGPIAILIVSFFAPEVVGGQGPEAVWRGLTTIAGSWIGGGANQAAMYEVFEVSPKIFPSMIAVDVIVANIWMAFLLIGAGKTSLIDRRLKADVSAIEGLKTSVESYQKSIARVTTTKDLMLIAAFGFGVTGLAHFLANIIAPWIKEVAPYLEKFSLTSSFFWLVVIATTLGLLLSFTKAKKLEGAGASKVGGVFIYILVATIGSKMDIMAIFDNPGLFLVGIIWMLVHVICMLSVAKLIKAPFFFVAVGSQANVGGAASAPIVASAFHPALASVGVLLAVLGYAVGTYGAWLCGLLMQGVAP